MGVAIMAVTPTAMAGVVVGVRVVAMARVMLVAMVMGMGGHRDHSTRSLAPVQPFPRAYYAL